MDKILSAQAHGVLPDFVVQRVSVAAAIGAASGPAGVARPGVLPARDPDQAAPRFARRPPLQAYLRPELVFSVVGTLLIIAITTVFAGRIGTLFNTPDETVNHLFTKTFAETGKLWYSTDYLALDQENLLHPRGVLSHDGRAVSYQYPTLPLVYGSAYFFVGENVKYVGALLALLALYFAYKIGQLLFGARYWQVLAVFLAVTPFVFHFTRPYMAAGPAIVFFMGGVWLLLRYFQSSQRRDLLLSAAVFSVAMLFRYEYALFSSLVLAAVLWHKHGGLNRSLARDLVTYGGVTIVLFVLPVLLMNYVIYGGPLTYGYSVFNDVYLPGRGAQEGAPFLENAVRMALEVVLPQGGSIDPALIGRNLARFIFGLMPILGTLALVGGLMAWRQHGLRPRYLIPYAAITLYLTVYMAGGDTWNAATKFATFDASFVRYWLPLDVLLMVLGLYALRSFKDSTTQAGLALVLAAYGLASVAFIAHGSLSDVDASVHRYESWSEEVIVPHTEEDALIYTGYVDKAIAPYRDVAAWWGGTYDLADVSASMSRVFYEGWPVYVYKETYFSIIDLNRWLEPYDLHAISTSGPGLFKVVKFDHSED